MPVRPVLARGSLAWLTVAMVGASITACGSSGKDGSSTLASRRTDAQSKTVLVKRSASARIEASGQSRKEPARCSRTASPTPKGAQRIPKPASKLDPSRSYMVSMATNCGTIQIKLDVRDAPRTTASFAYLVQRGFYDELTFHRVAAGFVIQGGDPNGDGSGGPGYTVVEPPPSDTRYTLGTVAMAKTGSDPAGASGSQFFIVTTREAALPPQYALVGNVVGSMTGVDAIARQPTDPPQDGAPRLPVVIERATLSSS